MPPLLITILLEIVTLEINVCPAVQVLVESKLTPAVLFTQVGAAPGPLLWRTWVAVPAEPPATSAPPPTTKFDDTVTALVLPPNVSAPPNVMALLFVPLAKEANA